MSQFGKLITVSSVKGGVGKTTLTINLAGLYFLMKKKVLIIDLDLYAGGVATLTNVNNKKDIYMLLCTVDFSNSSSTSVPVILDDKIAWVNEDNKIYAKNLLAHSKDNTNPHGKTLYQNDIKFHHLSTDFEVGNTKLNLPVYGAIYQDIIS